MLKSPITYLRLDVNNEILDLRHLVFIHWHDLVDLNAARLFSVHWRWEKVQHSVIFFGWGFGVSFVKHVRWGFVLREWLLFGFFELFEIENVEFLLLGCLAFFKSEDFIFLHLGIGFFLYLAAPTKIRNYWRFFFIVFLLHSWKFNRAYLNYLSFWEFNFAFHLQTAILHFFLIHFNRSEFVYLGAVADAANTPVRIFLRLFLGISIFKAAVLEAVVICFIWI